MLTDQNQNQDSNWMVAAKGRRTKERKPKHSTILNGIASQSTSNPHSTSTPTSTTQGTDIIKKNKGTSKSETGNFKFSIHTFQTILQLSLLHLQLSC